MLVLLFAFATMSFAGEETAASAASGPAVVVTKGKMLTGADGGRLGAVSRLSSDGAPQIIIDGKLVTVPLSTLSMVNDKLTTSLTKNEVIALH